MNAPLRGKSETASCDAWLPWLALAFGLVAIALPQSDFLRAIPGDLGDARFNGLILEHVFRWVRGIDASLWSPGFFFPFPGALTFSDNHFGTAGIYILLRFAGLDPEVAYIGWFTLAYAVNYLCAYYVLRQFGLRCAGGTVGAFLFAFAMPVLLQAGHAQLGYRFAVPLALLALQRLLRDGHPLHLSWLALWVTLQFYCSIYIGYFLLLLLSSYVLASYLLPSARSAFQRPDRIVAALVGWRERREFWRCVGTLLVCTVALFVLFVPYAYYAHLYGLARSAAEIESMLPRLGSYLLADNSRLWGGFSQHIAGIPMRHEQQMFVGAAACILAAIGVVRGASPWLKTSAIALLVLFVLTLDVRGHSLYAAIEPLPMANAIRAVSRICLVMVFPFALLAGAGVDRLAGDMRRYRRAGTILAALLAALLLFECAAFSTGMVPLTVWRARLAALRDKVPEPLAPDAIVFVPRQPGEPFFMTELDGMSLAQSLDRVTLNGYSGNSPPGFGETADPCDDLVDRLAAHARFMQLDVAQFDALAHRVVPIGMALQCELPKSLSTRSYFKGALPAAMFAQIRVGIARLSRANPLQLAVEVIVVNDSDAVLASLSNSNQPIRFSWRFVAPDAAAGSAPGWDSRSALRKDIAPHGRESLRLLIDAPTIPGRYRLELSMVQENVAWFHDRGMPIARSAQVIEVGDGGIVFLANP